MASTITDFTELIAWQKAQELVVRIYTLSKKFPQDERFGLTSQLRRSAVSIVSNIAEGFGRNTSRDKSQFYAIAKGSALEVRAQLLVARDLGYITDVENHECEVLAFEVIRLIAGLVKSSINR